MSDVSKIYKDDRVRWFLYLSPLLLLCALFLSSCAEAPPKRLTEADITKFITIEEAEKLLGQPYYSGVELDNQGSLKIRKYLSAKTRVNYHIAYWHGKVHRLKTTDETGTMALLKVMMDEGLDYDKSMQEVRELLGPPFLERGVGFKKFWWYKILDDKVCLLLFESAQLKAVSVIEDPVLFEGIVSATPHRAN
ncbi:MAG: hypothetical protein V3T30_05660 [Thermodesulfobacteriota bacterium]